MKKGNFKILQKHFSFCNENKDMKNYLILIEIEDGVPLRSYTVDMDGFMNYDSSMPSFYVFNKN
jgi:vancomycin permeability regulator SanA